MSEGFYVSKKKKKTEVFMIWAYLGPNLLVSDKPRKLDQLHLYVLELETLIRHICLISHPKSLIGKLWGLVSNSHGMIDQLISLIPFTFILLL